MRNHDWKFNVKARSAFLVAIGGMMVVGVSPRARADLDYEDGKKALLGAVTTSNVVVSVFNPALGLGLSAGTLSAYGITKAIQAMDEKQQKIIALKGDAADFLNKGAPITPALGEAIKAKREEVGEDLTDRKAAFLIMAEAIEHEQKRKGSFVNKYLDNCKYFPGVFCDNGGVKPSAPADTVEVAEGQAAAEAR